MRHLLGLAYCFAIAICAAALAEDGKISSVATNGGVVVDGSADDWRDAAFRYFDDDNTAIALRHDSANVYLIALSRDPNVVRQMETRGLTIWVNLDGKKNRTLGLRYRGGIPKSRLDERANQAAPEFARRRDEMLEEQVHARQFIQVVRKGQVEEIPQTGERGPIVASGFSAGTYLYEWRIPLTALNDQTIALGMTENSKLRLGLEFGYMTDDEKAKMKAHRGKDSGGFGPPVGGGGHPGGGPGGGMGGGRPQGGPPRGNSDQTSEIWLDVSLANTE